MLLDVPVFQGLGQQGASTLVASGRVRRHSPGEILFLEGEEGNAAYVVIAGSVDITVASQTGEELSLYRCGPGGYFGEMALLDGEPRSASATTAEPSVTLSITREALFRYLRSNPEAAILMLGSLSRRLRLADEKIKQLGFQGVAGRLAKTLVDLEGTGPGTSGIQVRHDQLAAMIGSRRPTVTSLLSAWREAGVVATGRGRVTILDRKALDTIAEQ